MDVFETKTLKPMLIGKEDEPFDSPDYLFELKFDGARCLAYLDKSTELRNKRNLIQNAKFPELMAMHRQVRQRCILDGELFVMVDGKPNFFELQRRTLMSNAFKIELAVKKLPANFVAFDMLYLDDKLITDLPLTERKTLLSQNVTENECLAVSRYIETKGCDLYALAVQNTLEGIVAKPKNSRYFFDRRSKDWIKIKYLKDDDFVICGYILKSEGVCSLVLGQYCDGMLTYKGHVTLGVSRQDFKHMLAIKRLDSPSFSVPTGNEEAVWLEPVLVCTVKYMEKTASGSLRQPVFKGLREDKLATDCIDCH